MRTYETYLEIRPYKKTLGIWFACTRTISWDLTWASDLLAGSDWSRLIHTTSGEEYSSGIRRYELEFVTTSSNSFDYHFGGYIGWGRTPSAPIINLSCKPEIF
jgi:hypothetical protein